MGTTSADEILTHVLCAHARLRERSAQLTGDALEAARAAGHIRGLVAELSALVADYDRLEETELVPLLSVADAWGAARVECLRACHARQRGALASVAEELDGSGPPAALIARIEIAIALLVHDLDEEEAAIPESDALASATVVTEQTSG